MNTVTDLFFKTATKPAVTMRCLKNLLEDFVVHPSFTAVTQSFEPRNSCSDRCVGGRAQANQLILVQFSNLEFFCLFLNLEAQVAHEREDKSSIEYSSFLCYYSDYKNRSNIMSEDQRHYGREN